MEAVYIISIIFLLFLVAGSAIVLFLILKRDKDLLSQNKELTAYNAELQKTNIEIQEINYDLQTLNGEYVNFVREIHGVLSDDVGFLRGELAEKLSLDIPEVRTLYQGLVKLLEDIAAIKDVVEESERIQDE